MHPLGKALWLYCFNEKSNFNKNRSGEKWFGKIYIMKMCATFKNMSIKSLKEELMLNGGFNEKLSWFSISSQLTGVLWRRLTSPAYT